MGTGRFNRGVGLDFNVRDIDFNAHQRVDVIKNNRETPVAPASPEKGYF